MIEDVKVLLVENDPDDTLSLLQTELARNRDQIIVETVTTLDQALDTVSSSEYDAILLNIMLPDSRGIDTLIQLQDQANDTAFVVLTNADDKDTGIKAIQEGAQDYLTKDELDGRLLLRSIRYAIERHRINASLRRSKEEYRSLIDDVFDTSMVAVLILDNRFHVVWCNEATEIYFGIERERLIGRDKRRLIDDELKCLFADPDDYATRLLKAYDEQDFTERFECHVLPDEQREERWLEHWSQPIRDGMFAGGRIEQYTDITDRKRLEMAEREQREFVEALHDVSTLLTSSLDLSEVLDRILANLGQVVPHDSASVTIIKDGHLQLVRHKSQDGQTEETRRAETRLQLDYQSYADIMARSGEPLIVSDMQDDPLMYDLAHKANAHSYVGSPIHLQDNMIGFINLISEEIDYFNTTHAERLSSFSQYAAIAIQNARLFKQSSQLATLEERQRIARELHDSVSQTLFICRAMSESVLRRWDKDPERAYELVEDINQLTRAALTEMRVLLLELRPVTLTKVGLKELFEQYLQPIQARRNFSLVLTIDDIEPLPPDVQIALYRITQEALNNIDKHAQASRVEVGVRESEDRVQVKISDNGSGFELDEVAVQSLGLHIMRERATEIGANIEIASEVNNGTQISVIWKKDTTT